MDLKVIMLFFFICFWLINFFECKPLMKSLTLFSFSCCKIQWPYSKTFSGTLLFADCVKIASNDNKFVLRATYFTNNPGGHRTMKIFFGSHFNFFSFNYSNMSKSNLNQHKCDKMRLRQKATHDTYKESNNTE